MSETAAVLPPEPPPSEENEVFWNFEDLAVFLLLGLPSLGLATIAVTSFLRLGWGDAVPEGAKLLGAQFVSYSIWFFSLYLLLRTRYRKPFWRSLGWVAPRRGLLPSGALGPVLAVIVVLAAAALETPRTASPIEKLISTRTGLMVVATLGSTVAPLCEELAFRGFIMPLLVRHLGVLAGIALAAAPFALLHGPQYDWQWQNVTLLFFVACVFGWTRYWSGSLIPAVLTHATYNLTLFAGYSLSKEIQDSW